MLPKTIGLKKKIIFVDKDKNQYFFACTNRLINNPNNLCNYKQTELMKNLNNNATYIDKFYNKDPFNYLFSYISVLSFFNLYLHNRLIHLNNNKNSDYNVFKIMFDLIKFPSNFNNYGIWYYFCFPLKEKSTYNKLYYNELNPNEDEDARIKFNSTFILEKISNCEKLLMFLQNNEEILYIISNLIILLYAFNDNDKSEFYDNKYLNKLKKINKSIEIICPAYNLYYHRTNLFFCCKNSTILDKSIVQYFLDLFMSSVYEKR